MAVSVFLGVGALGLLIGPGIAGGITFLGATFVFGGNFGGAKLILVAKETGGFAVVNVLDTSPLVNFVVPFVSFVVPFVSFEVPFIGELLNGFFAGAEIGRLKDLGKPLVKDCLLTNDIRCVVLVFGVVADVVAVVVFEVFGDVCDVLGNVGVVLVKDVTRGVVGVVFAEVGRDVGDVVFGAGLDAVFVTFVIFKVVVVLGATVGRTLVVGLEVDGAVVGLDKGFDVVDKDVFLTVEVVVFETNGFVGVVFEVVVLALETVVSTFFGADFLDAKATPAAAAIAAVPATAATAISPT